MGVSKVILVDPNTQTPEVLMDVTGDDTSAGVLLAGNVGTRNDGEKVTGNIPSKSSSDLTASGATVTAPAGYYSTAASKSVASGTQGTPSISVSSGGLITASATDTTGYITGSTKTATEQLSVQAAATVAPTESEQTAVAAGKYTTGEVKVGAIPSDYVGSGITQRSSSDLTASGATITAPAGYYSAAASKSVASGTTGTPTATKGSVSNHSVNVTPSVTNTTGYISGGTKTGTAVSVSASELVSGTKSIAANGTGIDVTNYASVDVAVPATPLQTKSATPSESAQTITPDSGYALSEVDISAIPSDYVGTGVPRRTASDLTKSGAIVFAPAGYYAETAGKSVDYGAQGTPTISVGSDGLITASCTDTTGYITGTTKTATQQMTARTSSDLTASGATVTAPAGYYSAAASKTVASGSATAPASISGTSATVSTGTNTLTLSKTVSVTPSVSAGYISSGTAGNSSVSLTASVTTKAAATITPGTSNQTIAAGTYLTGAQTIAGSANLVAGNIKSGVNIFGKVGTFAGDATVYKDAWTSRSAPIVDTSVALSLHREPVSIVSGTTIGDYALIGPYLQADYASGTSSESNEVIYINKHLSMGYAPAASVKSRGGAGAATVGNYALFAGGYANATANWYKVDTYTASLTHGTASNMTFVGSDQNSMPTAVVGNYAIFLPDFNSNIAGNAYNTSLTRSNVTAPSQMKRGPGVTVGNYAIFGPIGTGYPNTDVYNASLTRSTATQMTTPRGSSGAVAVGNYALFVAGYGSTQLTNTEYYTNTLTHGVVSAACEKHVNPACGTVGNYAIIASGITYGTGTVEYYTNTLTHATVGTNVLPQTYKNLAVRGCVLYGYVFTLGCGNDAINTIKVPYNLAVSVPASYTYTFNGETPTTVSSATSVTKTSGAPISGVVCKAATTKTGQIT